LRLESEDEESGIKSITCTLYDATLKSDVWTTTQDAQRIPRAYGDYVEPESPEGPDWPDESPERNKRV